MSNAEISPTMIGKYALYFVAGLLPLLYVLLPAAISEAAGGWSKKYTSNPNHFSIKSIPDMTGKVVLVTGGNTGIGFQTAKALTMAGAQVIFTARSQEKANAAAAKIADSYSISFPEADSVKLMPMVCDQSSLESVENFATQVKQLKIPIHIMVLNAGVMKSPGAQFIGMNLTYGFQLTEDGLEQQIGVNHIAHFYMTQLLTEPLLAGKGRVIVVSSSAHSGGYPEGIRPDTWFPLATTGSNEGSIPEWYEDGNSHCQSKLANILFSREFARRMEGTGVTAYSLHPGVIKSNIYRHMMGQKEMKDLSIAKSIMNDAFFRANMRVAP